MGKADYDHVHEHVHVNVVVDVVVVGWLALFEDSGLSMSAECVILGTQVIEVKRMPTSSNSETDNAVRQS